MHECEGQPGEALQDFDFWENLYRIDTTPRDLTKDELQNYGIYVNALFDEITRSQEPYRALCELREVFSLFDQSLNTPPTVRTFLRKTAEKFALHADWFADQIGHDIHTDDQLAQLFPLIGRHLTKKTSTVMLFNHEPVDVSRLVYLEDLVSALERKLPVLEKGLRDSPDVYIDFFLFFFEHTYSLEHNGKHMDVLAAFEKFLDESEERNHHLTRLLEEEHLGVLLAAETILANRIEKAYGADPDMLLDAWRSSAYDEQPLSYAGVPFHTFLHSYNTFKSLKTMDALANAHPGIIAYLISEYGIRHFGRYPAELLIEQFEKRNKRDAQPQLVIVFPYDDHNGAFYDDIDKLRNLFDEAKFLGVTVRAVEASSGRDIIRKLNRIYRKHGQIQAAVVGGHGTRFSIHFGPANERGYLIMLHTILYEPDGILSKAREKFFAPNAAVALVSCSTGQRSGLAEELSKYGLRVTAPSEDTSLKGIRLRRRGKILSLTPEYDSDIMRRVYKNGKRR